ncbi:MAG: DoxX family protein [Alphaproteobacteria bacterium]|nr:DoxX family protein [Alphaproteobacteria bacterium]
MNTNNSTEWAPAPSASDQPSYREDLVAICSRISLAAIFWQSGRTKVSNYLTVTESAVELFEQEYKLPFIPPEWAAHMAAYSEHLFPILLILGLFTRLTALGMLGMTAVIQIFVYPMAWPTHLSWAALMLYLVFNGAGRFSIDRFVR